LTDFLHQYRRMLESELGSGSVRSPQGKLAFGLDEVFVAPSLEIIAVPEEGGRASADPPERGSLSAEDLLLEVDKYRRVMLQASAGTGKSLLFRWLARSAARSGWTPFLLKAREWEKGDGSDRVGRFTEFVVGEVTALIRGKPTDAVMKLRIRDQLRKRERQIYLLDGLDEVLDPTEREDLWECWEAFMGDARLGIVTLRPEGIVDGIERSRYLQLGLSALTAEALELMASRWAQALHLKASETFVSEIRKIEGEGLPTGIEPGIARVLVNPMWVMIAAQVWRATGRLPGSRYALFEEYAVALLRREHDPRGGTLQLPEEVQREIRFAARVAREVWLVSRGSASDGDSAEVRGPGPRVAATRARGVLLADAAEGDLDGPAEVERVLSRWTGSGGLVEHIATRVPPGGFYFFQRQVLDFLLAVDAGEALGDFLTSGLQNRWPQVVEDEEQRQINDFLPHRLMSLVNGHALDLEELFKRLKGRSLNGVQRLVVGHLLERLLDIPPLDGKHSDWGAWRALVRDLLATSFPLDYGKRLEALDGVPEGIRVRAAESLARLGDPREELLDLRKANWSARDEGGEAYFLWIDRGEAEIGDTGERRLLEGFHIARFPVTVAQYRCFLEAAGSSGVEPEGWADQEIDTSPVICVTYTMAVAFCKWLGGEVGQTVRLPDEFEWQWAGWGGGEDRSYPWGHEYPDEFRANLDNRVGRIAPVGCYPAGAARIPQGGVEEMVGNVYEWTSSAFERTQEADPGARRVRRGGAFTSGLGYVQGGYHGFIGARHGFPPDQRERQNLSGFRVVW
jgi:formylglycine-generating enzyme required for sulfatase activity